jgi:hypothetical protein
MLTVLCGAALAQSAGPKIGPTFARVAVKTLLTIGGSRDKQLVDAAMINLSAAQSSRAELTVVQHLQLFEALYSVHQFGGLGHDEDQRCVVAWLPKLRAHSAEIPKVCPQMEGSSIEP